MIFALIYAATKSYSKLQNARTHYVKEYRPLRIRSAG